MFKNILIAIDGSDYSQKVVPAAVEVARKFEAMYLSCTSASTTAAELPSFRLKAQRTRLGSSPTR